VVLVGGVTPSVSPPTLKCLLLPSPPVDPMVERSAPSQLG
jgi:hypothetical protein